MTWILLLSPLWWATTLWCSLMVWKSYNLPSHVIDAMQQIPEPYWAINIKHSFIYYQYPIVSLKWHCISFWPSHAAHGMMYGHQKGHTQTTTSEHSINSACCKIIMQSRLGLMNYGQLWTFQNLWALEAWHAASRAMVVSQKWIHCLNMTVSNFSNTFDHHWQ